MDRDDRELLEDLQIRVKQLDEEIKIKEEEINALKAERAQCLKDIGNHSDEKYQQNVLELVYEQRMGARSRKK